MQQSNRSELGKKGETAVRDALVKYGFQIMSMNTHTRWGEIDIIALQRSPSGNHVLHVVEVKTRRTELYGGPESAMTMKKFRKMQRASWSIVNDLRPHLPSRISVQFDCAAVVYTVQRIHIRMYWNIGPQDMRQL